MICSVRSTVKYTSIYEQIDFLMEFYCYKEVVLFYR